METPNKCFFTAGGNRNVVYRGEIIKINGQTKYKVSWDHQPPYTDNAGHTTFPMRSADGAFGDGTWKVINRADNNEEALFLLNKDE